MPSKHPPHVAWLLIAALLSTVVGSGVHVASHGATFTACCGVCAVASSTDTEPCGCGECVETPAAVSVMRSPRASSEPGCDGTCGICQILAQATQQTACGPTIEALALVALGGGWSDESTDSREPHRFIGPRGPPLFG